MVPKKGVQTPPGEATMLKAPPGGDTQGIGHHVQAPFLNTNLFHWWYGIKNMVRVNRESCMALRDNGVQINTIMPGFVENIL